MTSFYSCLRGNDDCDIMASGPDVTGSQEPSDALVDCPGKKKSKFQTFKNFFVRKKRKGGDAPLGEAVLKASHSSDNVSDAKPTAAGGGAETDADAGQKVSMGNKAKSHDSVFVTDSPASDGSDDLTSTQDSVQEKVKALQLQLKQGSRQATPITLIGVRKDDDLGAVSEDDGLPCSPPEISTLHAVLADSSHKPSNSVQRRSSLSQEGSDTDDDQMSFEASSRPVSPPHYLFVDLGCPATPSSCLDTSAARHRIAVKNRACAKRKPASREFLDSGRERDLSGKVPGRGIENELGDDTPEPTSAEEKSKDFSVQQMDSAERTSEEWQLLAEEVQLVPKEVPPVEQSVPEEEPPMLEEPAGFHQWPRIEYEEQDAVDESSCCEDAPFPPSCSLSSSFVDHSQEFLLDPYSETQKHWGNRSLLTGSQESLDSLELPAENDTNPILELGCEAPVEESGSLLQEVLSSLEKPLASGLMLGPDAEDQKMEKVGESTEKVATCQGEESLPSSPTSQHEPVAQGGARTSYVAADQEEDESSASVQGEEHSEDKGDAELVEVSDEDSKEAKRLIVEPTMSTGGEKHKENEEEAEEEDDDHDEGDDEMNAEVASETQEHECLVEVQELDTHQQPEANTQAVVGLDSEGDEKPSSDEAVQVSSQGDEDYVQPSKESLSITDRVEPEQLIPSTEEPGQDIINLSSRASISPQHNEEDNSVKEDSGKHPVRFTIAPAWHRSLSGDGFKETYCHAPSIAAKASEACAEIKSEAGTPPKADIAHGDSGSHSSASLSPVKDQHVGAAETPFGVRLRKTSLRSFCYGTEDSGEPTGTPSEPPKAPCPEFPNSKPVLPRKPELLEDDVAKFRKTAESGAGRSPGGSLASPSWVYVAKQKQRIFRENSLEESPSRKDPFEKDAACRKNLSVFPKSTSKDQARISNPNATGLPPAAPCSLEISNPASSDKDGKRAVMSASPAALGPEEPPWLALAKKKAKAWSEMPQMVQ